jgi:hypothetical protein
VWYIFTNTSEEPAVSIFREMMEAANSFETLGTYYDSVWHSILEDSSCPWTGFCSNLHPYPLHKFTMAVKIKSVIFWVMTPCSFTGTYPRFGETCYPHRKDIPKMEVAGSSETLITIYKATQCHNKKDHKHKLLIIIKTLICSYALMIGIPDV